MADTYTPILNLLKQETGGNSNSWGTNLNDSVITPLENAVAGCLTISSLTGGAYTLTQENAVYGTIILTGTLSSDLTITVPSTANNWRFINQLTHAGFYVLIKVAAQTAVNIPHGKVTEITCDGTNMYRHDRENIGELFYHAGTTAPGGALECTGATPLRASALDLFAEIGTTWGTGNGTTTFTIPNGYGTGRYLRSRTASVAIGTAQSNTFTDHTHTGSGTTGNENANHTHTGSGTTNNENANHTHTGSGTTGNESANHTHTQQGTFTSGSESVSHTHGYAQGATQGWSNGTSGNVNVFSTDTATQTGGNSVTHTHDVTISGGTGSQSVNHTHAYSFTTATQSSYHGHNYSFTTATQGSYHGHNYSFTTSVASAGADTETRPETLVAMLCIRY